MNPREESKGPKDGHLERRCVRQLRSRKGGSGGLSGPWEATTRRAQLFPRAGGLCFGVPRRRRSTTSPYVCPPRARLALDANPGERVPPRGWVLSTGSSAAAELGAPLFPEGGERLEPVFAREA